MARINTRFSLAVVAGLLGTGCFYSCDESIEESAIEEEQPGPYANGVLIVNEGAAARGSVTYFNPETGVAETDIFEKANPGKKLQGYANAIYVDDKTAYIITYDQGDATNNRLEVVNADTFESKFSIGFLKGPRHFIVMNGKGYLTEKIDYNTQSSARVSVFDLSTLTVETTIEVDGWFGFGKPSYPGNLISAAGKLYLSNGGGVSVIDPATNKVVTEIYLGMFSGELCVDKNGNLWVVMEGEFIDGYNLNNGRLVRINTATDQVDKTVFLGRMVLGSIAMNAARDSIYFGTGVAVFKYGIDGPAVAFNSPPVPATPLLSAEPSVTFHALGFDAQRQTLYVSPYTGNEVFIYTRSGRLVNRFTADRRPNGFVFR